MVQKLFMTGLPAALPQTRGRGRLVIETHRGNRRPPFSARRIPHAGNDVSHGPPSDRASSRRGKYVAQGMLADKEVCLSVLPGARISAVCVSALTKFFVLAGKIPINGSDAGPASFVIVEPDAGVSIASDCGAWLLAWADMNRRTGARSRMRRICSGSDYRTRKSISGDDLPARFLVPIRKARRPERRALTASYAFGASSVWKIRVSVMG